MNDENSKPTSAPDDQPSRLPTGQPPEPTRPPNPNVLPPNPVQVQEGFSPAKETKLPNPIVKAPIPAQVQEMIVRDSTKSDSSTTEKATKEK